MEFLANNWLYFVFAGLMIFVMFKGGGCCGGRSDSKDSQDDHSHGGSCCGGDSHNKYNNENNEHEVSNNQMGTVKDPICGMDVNPDTVINQTVNGRTYYFCSESCRKEFIER